MATMAAQQLALLEKNVREAAEASKKARKEALELQKRLKACEEQESEATKALREYLDSAANVADKFNDIFAHFSGNAGYGSPAWLAAAEKVRKKLGVSSSTIYVWLAKANVGHDFRGGSQEKIADLWRRLQAGEDGEGDEDDADAAEDAEVDADAAEDAEDAEDGEWHPSGDEGEDEDYDGFVSDQELQELQAGSSVSSSKRKRDGDAVANAAKRPKKFWVATPQELRKCLAAKSIARPSNLRKWVYMELIFHYKTSSGGRHKLVLKKSNETYAIWERRNNLTDPFAPWIQIKERGIFTHRVLYVKGRADAIARIEKMKDECRNLYFDLKTICNF